ncbi:MAG TPA: hypothetical protein VJJ27_01130 [Candidatus Paceibacterota bacterium]
MQDRIRHIQIVRNRKSEWFMALKKRRGQRELKTQERAPAEKPKPIVSSRR